MNREIVIFVKSLHSCRVYTYNGFTDSTKFTKSRNSTSSTLGGNTLTIDDIVALSPPLQAIIARAAAAKGKPYRDRLSAYTRAKREAEGFIGYGSPVEELQSAAAWETLTMTLSDILDI